MRSDESRVSKSRASSPDGRGVTLPISEPFPINPQTSASPNAGQPLAMQKHVRQTIITQQHCVQLAFFRNAGLPAELCRPAGAPLTWAAQPHLAQPNRNHVAIENRRDPILGKQRDLCRLPAFVEHLDRSAPRRPLAVVDLPEIEHLSLNYAPTLGAPVLDDRPGPMHLAVFAANLVP